MAKTFSLKSDDPLKFLSQEALGSRASMDDSDDDTDDDSSSGSSRDDDDDDEDDDDSSSGSSRDDNDDFVLIDGVFVKLRGDGSVDDSQPGGLRDDFVQIDGVFVKLRGDGSVDDSQPNGLIRANGNGGFKLRGDGSIDDSQPGELRIVGTRKDDQIIGTGVTRETLIGRKGSDDFILGNRKDSYYQDGRKDRTYAIMKDFSGKDEVILHGSRSDYKFTSTKVSGVNGTGIFYKDDDGTDLIGLIAGKVNLSNGSLDFL